MMEQAEKTQVSALRSRLGELVGPPAVYGLFVTLVIGLTLLQKLALPMGGGKALGIPLPIALLALSYRYLRYRAFEADARRVVVFTLFCVFATLSQSLSRHSFSPAAMFLLFILYFPVVLRIEVDRKLYLKCMNFFQWTMAVVAVVVLIQQVMQRLWGWQSWPNMNVLIPVQIQQPNYNYWREMGYNVGLFQPNAVFFLEPSFVSQFLALAIVVEVVFFERLFMVALLTVGLFLTFAGTGLLVLTAAAPFLLARLSPRILIVCLVVGALVGLVGGALGWFDQFLLRIGEINQPGTSGYYRFNVPFQNLLKSVRDWDSALFGAGAGNQQVYVGADVVDMAINKLMDEYGLFTTIAFYICFCYALFESAPNLILAWAIFVCFNFCGGALAVPVYVIIYVVLGTMLRIKPEDPEGQPLERAPREPKSIALAIRTTAMSLGNP